MKWLGAHFLLGLGYVAGFFSCNAMLIDRFGTENLFDIYLMQGLATLALSLVFFRCADRYPRRRFAVAWFSGLGGVVLILALSMAWFPGCRDLFLVARACLDAVAIAASLGFWLLAGAGLSHREAKRRFPKLLAAFILGDMAGGCLIQLGGERISGLAYLGAWALILTVVPWLVRASASTVSVKPRVRLRPKRVSVPVARRRPSPLCAFAWLLFGFWLFYAFFSDATDYVFNTWAAREIPGEGALRDYFGQVALIGNAAIGLYHFFFGKRTRRRYGIDFTVFLIPLLIFAVWTSAWIRPNLVTLGLAQGMIYFFIDYVAVSQLNATLMIFPKASRGRVQSVTEGLGRALGVLALWAVARSFGFQPTWEEMSRTIWIAAVLFLGFPLWFRPVYLRHLLNFNLARPTTH